MSKKETPKMYGLEHKLDSKCVYVHFIKSINIPIYIGEGSVERAFNFTNRNNKWKELVSNLNDVHVEIVAIDITKEECIEIEKQLIKLYKERGFELVNCNNGGSCIGAFGEDNYFYNKHLFGKDNGNYGNKYSKNPLSIKVIQLDIFGNVIKKWSSAQEAEEIGGYIASCINSCCNGKRQLHNNYQWIFAYNYNPNKSYEYIPKGTSMRIYLAIGIRDNKSYIHGIYNSGNELTDNGFNPRLVQQVVTGYKKSHKGFAFVDFFRLTKEQQDKYKEQVIAKLYS